MEIVAAVDYQSQVPGPKDAPVRRQLNDESVNISSAGRQMTRPVPTPAKEQNEHYADTLAALLARQQKLNPSNPAGLNGGAPMAAAGSAPRTLAEQGQWGAAPEPAKPKARVATPVVLPSLRRESRRWKGCARRWPVFASCLSTESPD